MGELAATKSLNSEGDSIVPAATPISSGSPSLAAMSSRKLRSTSLRSGSRSSAPSSSWRRVTATRGKGSGSSPRLGLGTRRARWTPWSSACSPPPGRMTSRTTRETTPTSARGDSCTSSVVPSGTAALGVGPAGAAASGRVSARCVRGRRVSARCVRGRRVSARCVRGRCASARCVRGRCASARCVRGLGVLGATVLVAVGLGRALRDERDQLAVGAGGRLDRADAGFRCGVVRRKQGDGDDERREHDGVARGEERQFVRDVVRVQGLDGSIGPDGMIVVGRVAVVAEGDVDLVGLVVGDHRLSPSARGAAAWGR